MQSAINKASVIIPVKNGEKTLGKCLDSVLNQTYQNYEVIVVDNNSTDKTKKIINRFQKYDHKIKYIFEKRVGRGSARNTGEKFAKGDVILMTDSDCIVPKNWIEHMIKPIAEKKAVAVQGIIAPPKDNLNYWTKHIQKEREKIFRIRDKDKKVGLLASGNFAIKKYILKNIGYSNPNIVSGNDTELDIRLREKNNDILLNPIKVLHYEPTNAFKVFKKFFIRGMWNQKIRNIYKNNLELFDKNIYLEYFLNLTREMVALNENFKYDLVTGTAWRLGGLYEKFCNNSKK